MNQHILSETLFFTWGVPKTILPKTLGLRLVLSRSVMVACLPSLGLMVERSIDWNFSGRWAGRWLAPSWVSCRTIEVLEQSRILT